MKIKNIKSNETKKLKEEINEIINSYSKEELETLLEQLKKLKKIYTKKFTQLEKTKKL